MSKEKRKYVSVRFTCCMFSFVSLSLDWKCQGDGKVKFFCQKISATFGLVQFFVDETFLSENRKAFYSILHSFDSPFVRYR